MDDVPGIESAKDRDEELIGQIRSQINKVEALIMGHEVKTTQQFSIDKMLL